MSPNAKTLMQELRDDHRNMSTVLDLLDDVVQATTAGRDPDFELIDEIMRYMTVYPDAVHHPKEDRLYAELRTARPDLSQGFDRITLDHRQIAEQSIALRDSVAAVAAGNPVHRNKIVTDALRYVNTMRGHMQWEELDLFRRLDEMINSGHAVIDAANFVHRPDPVFGASVERKFGRLFESIQELAACG
jgi:hemerythrin-like domain-containing protein